MFNKVVSFILVIRRRFYCVLNCSLNSPCILIRSQTNFKKKVNGARVCRESVFSMWTNLTILFKNKIPSFQNIAHILKGYGHEFRHFKLSFGYVFAYTKKVSDLDIKWM